MAQPDFSKLKVDHGRLMQSLHETCAFGTGKRWGSAETETGMSRLALSDADKQVRDWFVATTRELGCAVTVDAMGNIFAVRPGRRRRGGGDGVDGPPTFAGSHLDTQPNGGRYDGILGVQAGVEMLRVLRDHGVETNFPVGVVNWTNEEGARFPIITMSSAVWAEAIPLEHAHGIAEVGGGDVSGSGSGSGSGSSVATVKSELERIGYLGATPASHRSMPMGAHFELHIEQGPILEAEGQKVGVVHGVQAYRWFTVEVHGRDAHTGTTPLANRADALLTAARLITHAHRLATRHACVASTGILSLEPGSTNTLPGYVRFTLDVRAPADATVDAMEADMKRDFAALAGGEEDVGGLLAGSTPGRPCRVTWRTDADTPATRFHPDCIAAVRAAAEVVTGDEKLVRDMNSGAGHDSVYTSRWCPTSMIFVPSKDGVSHNPEEFTSPEECAIGAEVLLQSVLRYDHMRQVANQ
ncbi:amidase [Xylariomycetidae sp. FL2044]|nr:amidase [Xylariomycetidae sp. FL2044]